MKIFLDDFKIQKVIIPREGIIRRINLRAIEIKDDKNYNWQDPIEISVGLPHEREIDSAELIYILEQFIIDSEEIVHHGL